MGLRARVEQAVQDGRLAGGQRPLESGGELFGGLDPLAMPAEGAGIGGAVFFALGAIFLFNTLSHNWGVWAYAWILIPASVGLGLMLAAKFGEWNNNVWLVGVWMALISVTVFAVFAALFGNLVVKFIGAGVLVALGLLLLIRSILKKAE